MPAFTEVLDMMRISWRKGSRVGEVNLCCPFCTERGETEDTRFRLGLNVIHDVCSCFNCGYKSRQAKKWVLRKLGATEEASKERAPKKVKAPLPTLPEDFEYLWKVDPEDVSDPRSLGFEYLSRRGFTVRDMKRYKIGVTLVGRYAYRILFQVIWRGKLRGLVARDFTGTAKAKYLNSVGDKYIWNMPEGLQGDKMFALAEGCFKSIALERALKIPSGAVLGHSITAKQMKQLKAYGAHRVLIWPDPGRPGIKGMVSMCELLNAEGIKAYAVWPVPSAQADELSKAQLKKLYATRVREFDWALTTQIKSALSFGDDE